MMHRLLPLIFLAVLTLSLAFTDAPPDTVEQLGKRLFFDPILSADSTLSCGSCHRPAFGFADTLAFSRGVGGKIGRRNTPGITNMTARPYFLFDGRAATLEAQVLLPIQDALEMQINLETVIRRLQGQPAYNQAFKEIFGRSASVDDLATALAAFVRTLETGNTPFDRWMTDQPNPMNEAAVRGRRIFMNKGKCFDCHFSPDFTGDEFRNIGLYTGQQHLTDTGRFGITGQPADLGKFKVQGLRKVALTAPYMHNGMFRTLEEVIEYYDRPDAFVPNAIGRDSLLAQPLQLTPAEKSDLKTFLEALTEG